LSLNIFSMSKKMQVQLEKHIHERRLKRYIENNPPPKTTKYFLNPMRPGVRLTKAQRLLRINRYKLKRNKRKWGISTQEVPKQRSKRNRRLRIQGRFISKLRACKLLFGPEGEKLHEKYSFEELTSLLNEKYPTKK